MVNADAALICAAVGEVAALANCDNPVAAWYADVSVSVVFPKGEWEKSTKKPFRFNIDEQNVYSLKWKLNTIKYNIKYINKLKKIQTIH